MPRKHTSNPQRSYSKRTSFIPFPNRIYFAMISSPLQFNLRTYICWGLLDLFYDKTFWIKMNMITYHSDTSLFFQKDKSGNMIGLIVVCIEDSFYAGSNQLVESSKETLKKLQSRQQTVDTFRFFGLLVQLLQNGIQESQTSYVQCLETDPKLSIFKAFISKHAKPNWNTPPAHIVLSISIFRPSRRKDLHPWKLQS